MCKEHNPRKIDKCMEKLIYNLHFLGVHTKACCCGHGIYPMTIIVGDEDWHNFFIELFSSTIISRKKKFYKKDKNGYYYIPEISKS